MPRHKTIWTEELDPCHAFEPPPAERAEALTGVPGEEISGHRRSLLPRRLVPDDVTAKRLLSRGRFPPRLLVYTSVCIKIFHDPVGGPQVPKTYQN